MMQFVGQQLKQKVILGQEIAVATLVLMVT